MDDAQTDARTVMLSDGSVWTLEVSRVSGQWWHRIGDVLQLRLPQLTGQLPLTAADHRKIADVLDPPAALASPRATGSEKATHRELSSEISALWTRIEARFWKGHEEGCAGRQDSEGEFDGCNCANHDAERALEELAELAAERSTKHADAEDALGRLYNYNTNPDSDAAERDRLIVVRALRASPSLASASADDELRQIDLAFGNVSALDGLTRAEKAAKCVKMLAALNAPAELPASATAGDWHDSPEIQKAIDGLGESVRDYAVALAADLDEVGKLAPTRRTQMFDALYRVLDLVQSTSRISDRAGDWRTSKAVTNARDAIYARYALAGRLTANDSAEADYCADLLDELCDAVQSHARAASPPVPESPSPDTVRIEKLSALARECAVTLCYYPEADGGPIYSVIHRKIRDGATLCEAIDATEHGS